MEKNIKRFFHSILPLKSNQNSISITKTVLYNEIDDFYGIVKDVAINYDLDYEIEQDSKIGTKFTVILSRKFID